MGLGLHAAECRHLSRLLPPYLPGRRGAGNNGLRAPLGLDRATRLCGTSCRSCRHRCEYQPIDEAGSINYRECFQHLDCVPIYRDDKRHSLLIAEKK